MKWWPIIVLATVLVGVTGFWINQSNPPEPPLLVVMDSPQMAHSQFDPTEIDAAKLYLEEFPNSPFDTEFFFYDFDQTVTLARMQQQLDQGRQFFITTQPSQLAVSSSSLFSERGQRLLINTSATTTKISGKDDAIVRVIPDLEQEQRFIAQHIMAQNPQRLLILVDTMNAGYTLAALDVLLAQFEQSPLAAVHVEKINFLTAELADLTELINQPWDFLYVLGGDFQPRIGQIGHYFQQQHPQAPLLLTPWARSPVILKLLTQSDRPLQMVSHYPWMNESPELTDYFNRFQARFGYEPHFMAVKVRKALEILHASIAAVGTHPDAVQQHILQQRRWDTSVGVVELDEFGDAQARFHVLDARTLGASP